jgi:hypothetical protein
VKGEGGVRVGNRIAAGLLGLVLFAAGLLAIAEAALVAVGSTPWLVPLDRWHARLSNTTLASNKVLGVSIVVGSVGLIILALQLRPWRPRRLVTGDAHAPWWVARRSVEQRTALAVSEIPGVHNARADVRGREKRWRLRLRADANPEQRDEVTSAVRHELDRLAVPRDIAVKYAFRLPRRVA